ncbi:MAG: penicillin acylase family protein, partial [Proteobacteria bacterium]|nr:penicillin acylase family protein [Pseudomonadota bacterium]
LFEPLPPVGRPGLGSNNWVVAGDRSETGKPLLANDPHLGLGAPATFYLAHLNAPGLNVVGATLPGMPGVLLGRNDRIAWGFTNTGPDTQDLFIERVDANDAGRYLAPGGSRPFTVRREVIAVAGADEVALDVRESRHGPVISDLAPGAAEPFGGDAVLALAWTALRGDDLTPRAALAIGQAGDWAEFVAALRDFHGPQQNIIYADVDGNIGLLAPARLPIRKAGDGWVPAPGSSGAFDWSGFVPFDELPRALNPPSGRIVTANNRIVADDYPHFITRDWAPPYRARRITGLLEGRRHTLESFRAIQADTTSLMARAMTPHLLRAEPETAAARAAQALLADWRGDMARDRPEPLIFSAWYRALTRLVYADELGPLFDAAWGLRPLFMRSVLDGDQAAWCDDTTTQAVENCPEMTARALDSGVAELAARYGDDPAAWRWGDAHPAVLAHRVFRGRPLLGALFGISIANGGDPFTVNAAGYALRDPDRPFAQNHGPVFRAIYDLADLERSLFVLTTGQSGNPLSRHYRDFVERWRDHRPFTIPTRRIVVEAAAEARLDLVPR